MAVMLADRALTVIARKHPWVRDERGVPLPSTADDLTTTGPFPGAAALSSGQEWTLRVDAGSWPVRAGDRITDDRGNSWVANGTPVLHAVPGAPDVDHIAVTATLEPPQVP